MSTRLAVLCPGQGAQHPQMFDLACGDPQVAARVRDWPVPPLAGLFQNRIAQPAIVAAGCAAWETVRDRVPAPRIVAGYSIGEVTALAVSGMLEAPAAITLAGVRAGLMDACVDPSRPQGLMAISGLTLTVLTPLLAHGDLDVAIDNGVDHIIVGGRIDALLDLQALLTTTDARMQVLPVEIASHTRLMAPAMAPLVDYLGTCRFGTPRVRLLSGVAAEPVTGAAEAIAALAGQLTRTVRWAACMDAIAEGGVTAALELGPGNALSRMLAARHPQIICRSVADFRSTAGLLSWIERLDG